MSIATAIEAAQQKVANAYSAVSNKGGTLPATQNLSNLPTAINSIPTGGPSPVIDSLTITPTTSQQTITAPSGTDGYSPITVNAVTSSIDNNITAGNIKKDVVILGVTGTYEGSGGTDNLPAFVSDGISSFSDNTITEIRRYAFYAMSSTNISTPLTSVSCANVEEIGNNAFTSCTSLTTVNLPKVKTIGNTVFSSCSSLVNLTNMPDLTSIGSTTFSSCSSLTSFTVSENVTSIGNSAFNNCSSMTQFNYNAKNATITANNSNGVFQNLGSNASSLEFNIGSNVESIPAFFLYSSTNTNYFPKITTLNIPNNNSITKIGQTAFYNCKGITSLVLPSMTSVSTESMQGAFQGCSNLVTVSIPNLTSASYSMQSVFQGCTALTSISMPKLTSCAASGLISLCRDCTSLTTVDLSLLENVPSYALRYAFQNCTSLTTLSFPALTSTSFGNYKNQFNSMLTGVTGCTVHFPSNLQSVIGSWADVTAGFGGTNTTILFDLPATT